MTGPRPLARTIPRIAARALGRQGQAFGALLVEWPSIMGPVTGTRCIPEKLSFPRGRREGATLSIRAPAGLAVEIQHAEPQIVERINTFLGFPAVARLRLVQAPLRSAPRPPRYRPRPLSEAEEAGIRESVAGIEDEGLRDAMTRLGRAISARTRGRAGP